MIAIAVCLLCVAQVKEEASELEREPAGWIDLLDEAGPDLKGWTRGPIPPTGKLREASQWSYDPATKILVCEGDGGHEWLRWKRELADFTFHVEWRFTTIEGKPNYNSGIYVRNSSDARVWHQAQTGSGSGGFLFGETPVGEELKRFNLSKDVKSQRVKPAGEWNTFEISCRGPKVRLWVNGAETCSWADCRATKGYVGLEAEGYRIEFRNVKVRPVEPVP